MTRLDVAFHRLYQPADTAPGGARPLFDAQGRTRAAVLDVATPADGLSIGAVWTAVQTDLGLPAPAIAVDGRGSLQLWFALAEPVDAATARAFLEAVCRRCLPALPSHRLRLWPTTRPLAHAAPVPAEQPGEGRWSAFVAPDLAPLFEVTPWLDGPPGDAAQARILAGAAPVTPAQVADVTGRAVATAGPAPAPTPGEAAGDRLGGAADAQPPTGTAAAPVPPAGADGPRAFLWSVMADPQAPLALRVQAAVALLPWVEGGPPAPSGVPAASSPAGGDRDPP